MLAFRNLRVSSLQLIRRAFSAVNHNPPKKLHGPNGRYSMATYTAASKAGSLDKVEEELLSLSEALKKSPTLAAYLGNPTIPRPEKTNKLNELLDASKFSSITRNLFLTLAINGRAGETNKVIDGYLELMQASRGAVHVTITSAEALKKKQVEAIQAAVLKMVGAGKTVDVKLAVDPSILSGLQVLVGDKFLDLSVSSRIANISKILESTN